MPCSGSAYVVIYLQVPFAHKDTLKTECRARWSPEKKQWYIIYDYESGSVEEEEAKRFHKRICKLNDFLKTINSSITDIKDELDTFGTYRMILGKDREKAEWEN